MRTALAISAIAHALFWGVNAWQAPEPANEPMAPVLVEIVAPDEIDKPPDTANKPAPDRKGTESPQSQPVASKQGQIERQEARERSGAQEQRAAQADARPSASEPVEKEAQPRQFAAAGSWLQSALNLPAITTSAFDSTQSSAKLSSDEIASFRAHLQQCWEPPAAIEKAQQLVVVLRVSLKPDGALAAEPAMVAASASANGPALVQTAVRALLQCQPYRFLPAAKYEEWKLLDLSFSPNGLRTLPVL